MFCRKVVVAPPGKLGMLIVDSGDDGSGTSDDDRGRAVINEVDDNSPLAGKVFEGDRVVAVNGVDVHDMDTTAIKEMLRQQEDNERLITIAREMPHPDSSPVPSSAPATPSMAAAASVARIWDDAMASLPSRRGMEEIDEEENTIATESTIATSNTSYKKLLWKKVGSVSPTEETAPNAHPPPVADGGVNAAESDTGTPIDKDFDVEQQARAAVEPDSSQGGEGCQRRWWRTLLLLLVIVALVLVGVLAGIATQLRGDEKAARGGAPPMEVDDGPKTHPTTTNNSGGGSAGGATLPTEVSTEPTTSRTSLFSDEITASPKDEPGDTSHSEPTPAMTSTMSPATPSNDECDGAIYIALNDEQPTIYEGSTLNATADFPSLIDRLEKCGATSNSRGVWFTFHGKGMSADILYSSGLGDEAQMSLFSGSCDDPVCEKNAGSSSSLSVALESDKQYWLFLAGTATSAVGDFKLRVISYDPSNVSSTAPPMDPLATIATAEMEPPNVSQVPAVGSHTTLATTSGTEDQEEHFYTDATPAPAFCPVGYALLEVHIKTDGYPLETYWTVYNLCTRETYAPRTSYLFFEHHQYNHFYCVPEARYIFVIRDDGWDGICCQYGSGYYSVLYQGQKVASGNGQFRDYESSAPFGSCGE